jgi:Family of unknown function (DUF5989)
VDTLRELVTFMFARKKFWLWPVILMLLLIGGLLLFSQGSAIAPFVYTIF